MNIAVPIRLMPNVGDELEVDAGGTDIDRDLVEMVLNEFDEQALEEAVLIKEATGATVTAIGLESEGMEQALRTAFARGADRMILVNAGEVDPYDTRTAALACAQAIEQIDPDLVLVGVQTPYDVFGQTAPYLAARLGWPQANVVVKVSLDEGTASVQQEYAGGSLAVLELTLPAVAGVQSASSPPRYISMARMRQAMSGANIEMLEVAVQSANATPQIVSMSRPERQAGAQILEGDPAQVAARIAALLTEKGALVS